VSERSERDRRERAGGSGGGVGRQAALQLEQRAGPRFIDPAEIYKTSRAHLFPPPLPPPHPLLSIACTHPLRDTREKRLS